MEHLPVDDPAHAATTEASVLALIDASTETNRYIQALETQLRSRTRALWGAIIASAVVVVVLGAGWVDNRAGIADLQQKMCPMVTSIIPRPGDPQPPPGPAGDRGRLVIARFAALAKEFGCAAQSSPATRPSPSSSILTPPALLPTSPTTRRSP